MPFVKHVDMRALVATHGKRCSKCHRKKSAFEFNNCKNRYDGKQGNCRECQKLLRKKKHETSEKRKEYRRNWAKENRDKCNLYCKRYRQYKKDRALAEAIKKVKDSYRVEPGLIGSSIGAFYR